MSRVYGDGTYGSGTYGTGVVGEVSLAPVDAVTTATLALMAQTTIWLDTADAVATGRLTFGRPFRPRRRWRPH